MSARGVVYLNDLEGRIDYPNDFTSRGQILMNFLKSILSKIAWGDDLHGQSRSTVDGGTVDINALKMSGSEKRDIGPAHSVGGQKKVGLTGDVSKFAGPRESSQGFVNPGANLVVSQGRGWGHQQFSFIQFVADRLSGLLHPHKLIKTNSGSRAHVVSRDSLSGRQLLDCFPQKRDVLFQCKQFQLVLERKN